MVSGSIVPFAAKLHVLGLTLDSNLSLDDHVTGTVHACNYHLRVLRHIRPLITPDAANTIACSIVCSRLDYCNIILYGVSDYNTSRLHRSHSVPRPVQVIRDRSLTIPSLAAGTAKNRVQDCDDDHQGATLQTARLPVATNRRLLSVADTTFNGQGPARRP